MLSESVASQSQQRSMLTLIDRRGHNLTVSDLTLDRTLVWRCGRSWDGRVVQTGKVICEPASRKCIPIKDNQTVGPGLSGANPPFF